VNIGLVNLRPLNSGGYGDLFLAQRSDSGAWVVVKFPREHWLPHARRAFEREVRLLRRNLYGLVQLLSADTAAERPYYVMPYLAGGPLTRYAGMLTDGQLQAVAVELAKSLAALHGAFEAHGDVKPDNILITREGQIRVADPLGNGTLLTMLFSKNRGGTPGYCAPEIWAGAPISRAGDVFSFAATMYHLATGRRPQQGQRLDLPSVALWEAPGLREAIAACSNFDPNARPSMQDVLRILRGDHWLDIQAERQQAKAFVGVACAVGFLVWLAFAQGA
jgi:serine/threonine protein kinase